MIQGENVTVYQDQYKIERINIFIILKDKEHP